MNAIPNVNCIDRSMRSIYNANQSLSGLGKAPSGCRWINMGPPLGWVWVCFGGGGYSVYKQDGTLLGVSSQQLPYCDELANQNIFDQVIAWVKQNPLLAAGIGVAAYFLFLK